MRLKICQAFIGTSLRMLSVVPDRARPLYALETLVRDELLGISSPSGIQVSFMRLGLGMSVFMGLVGEYSGRGLVGCWEGAGVLGDESPSSVDSTWTAYPLEASIEIDGRPVLIVADRSWRLRTSMRFSKYSVRHSSRVVVGFLSGIATARSLSRTNL